MQLANPGFGYQPNQPPKNQQLKQLYKLCMIRILPPTILTQAHEKGPNKPEQKRNTQPKKSKKKQALETTINPPKDSEQPPEGEKQHTEEDDEDEEEDDKQTLAYNKQMIEESIKKRSTTITNIQNIKEPKQFEPTFTSDLIDWTTEEESQKLEPNQLLLLETHKTAYKNTLSFMTSHKSKDDTITSDHARETITIKQPDDCRNLVKENQSLYNKLYNDDDIIIDDKDKFMADNTDLVIQKDGITQQGDKEKLPCFLIFLLSAMAPYSYRESMSLQGNHRWVEQTNLERQVTDEMILTHNAKEDKVNQVFQNKPLEIFPYETTQNNMKDPLPYRSIAKINTQLSLEEPLPPSAMIEYHHMQAQKPSLSSVKSLAIALGCDKNHKKITFSQGMVNWKTLFSKLTPNLAIGADVTLLNELCQLIHLPFRYKPEASPGLCNIHFRTFFRSITNIEIGALDGGHR